MFFFLLITDFLTLEQVASTLCHDEFLLGVGTRSGQIGLKSWDCRSSSVFPCFTKTTKEEVTATITVNAASCFKTSRSRVSHVDKASGLKPSKHFCGRVKVQWVNMAALKYLLPVVSILSEHHSFREADGRNEGMRTTTCGEPAGV